MKKSKRKLWEKRATMQASAPTVKPIWMIATRKDLKYKPVDAAIAIGRPIRNKPPIKEADVDTSKLFPVTIWLK